MARQTTHANSYNVDWLTVTGQGKHRGARLVAQVVQFGFGDNGQLPIQEPWFFKGFRGYRSEGIRYGTNNKGDGIAQLSGSAAAKFWPHLKDLWDTCSRLDLAATVFLPEIDQMAATRAYNSLSGQRKAKTTLIQNNRGGATCYIGSRSSSRYARIYDKGAESHKQPGLIWRYEVEFKKPVSGQLLAALEAAGDVENLIAIEVREHFARYGIEVPFAPTIPHDAIQVPRDLTSQQKALQWLVKQVAPAVHKLIEAGLEEEVFQALGLLKMPPEFYFANFKENPEWP